MDSTAYTGGYEAQGGVYSEAAASQPAYTPAPAQQAPAAPTTVSPGARPIDPNADQTEKGKWGGDMNQWAK